MIRALLPLLLPPLLLLPACGGDPASDGDGTITIGCKNFTEQYILLHVLEHRLEACGFDVRTEELAGTMICHKALERGKIDGYVEYTGTALMAVFDLPRATDADAVLDTVREKYGEGGFSVLGSLGFANSYGIAVRSKDAEENGWSKVSDLAGEAGDLTAGFTSEFQERADGYPRLKEVYGFSFGDATDLDPGTMYDALAQEHVDLICAFTTDARLAKYGLVVLEDDRKLWPPYDAVPVFRKDTLERHPEIKRCLAPLVGSIDEKTMIRLNHAVDVEKRDADEVARDYLAERGLLED
jgi:osmoprotectant transport system substrate-binding protein